MGLDRSLTRRRWLALSGAMAVSLAGCSSDPPQAMTPARSVFVGRHFEGGDLRIDLREGHSVDRLNLIGPDGRRYSHTEVATGETTVSLQLLDIQPGGAGFEHYTPGSHDLIAISGEEEIERTTIDLRPELRIVDVRQYREGEDATDYGKLVVEVENVGTGPTWIHSITFQNSPNYLADEELGRDPGVPWISHPTDFKDLNIHPGQSKIYIGMAIPLVLDDKEVESCEGSYEFDLFVESPVLEPISTSIQIRFDGQIIPVNLTGKFTCDEIAIEGIS